MTHSKFIHDISIQSCKIGYYEFIFNNMLNDLTCY